MEQRDILDFLKVKRIETNKYVSLREVMRGIKDMGCKGTTSRDKLKKQLTKLYLTKVIARKKDDCNGLSYRLYKKYM